MIFLLRFLLLKGWISNILIGTNSVETRTIIKLIIHTSTATICIKKNIFSNQKKKFLRHYGKYFVAMIYDFD
jgi:hypothetical protein